MSASAADDIDDAMDDTDEDEYNYDTADYYSNTGDETDIFCHDPRAHDPEHFEFECLPIEEAEKLLNENVELLSRSLNLTPALAKLLLHTHFWNVNDILKRYECDSDRVLIEARIKPEVPPSAESQNVRSSRSFTCPVCYAAYPGEAFRALSCGHYFCTCCWATNFEIQVLDGISTGMECMHSGCKLLIPEDFVINVLAKSNRREKYRYFAFKDYVQSHPELRFCPGKNCAIIARAKQLLSKRVICTNCKTTFCFKCGADYHAPTDCDTIKQWTTKCADDSETANYISAHTKDCPKCHICIEKNGGCNHMQCYHCKHDFCWMCLGDWKAHGTEYYECSRYKENPNIANESANAQAREALKKYLFYFERWENHSRSLKLEAQTLNKIKSRIQEKVMANEGTWIDWQYLLDAANLLAKCRYTLQYTYPYAYYMEAGPRKALFEYQQAQLEAEIENLSWKIERAETTDRGDLENQMDIAEKRRTTLLKDFLQGS